MTNDSRTIDVAIGPHRLEGSLFLPQDPRGLIIFAHGSGSSRFSPRNRYVAERLLAQGFACLLFDLLTAEEGDYRRNVFDIPLLGARVIEAIAWAGAESDVSRLPIGLFGASTGAAAALTAAAEEPRVAAVVSRGGRPDLAGDALRRVQAPTLLIVGGLDYGVIELNRSAQQSLSCRNRLDIVPGATHLFEEPGTLESVVERATKWFIDHLDATRDE
jgi:putative phosphoribosyl transferase